jgi:shikimate dehydrogenase
MLTGATRVVGIIGDPVSHSLSPRMHNAAFAACKLDWVYVPLPVRADALPQALAGLLALGVAGANVTIPHKTAVAALCDTVDEVARRAASVNTLVVRDGRVHGSTTDGLAVTGAVSPSGARVLMLGAGGSAQAVSAALLEAGAASLTVAARRPEAADELVLYLRSVYGDADLRRSECWPPDLGDATLLVNSTPLKDDVATVPAPGLEVVDLAYRPDGKPTALVAAAQAAGCSAVVDGFEVLVRQGAASFERWTGVAAPVEVMEAAVRAG